MAASAEPSALAVLRRPGLRRWILARLFAGVAITSVRATVLWQVYDITKSTALLGLVGLLSFIPAPFAALSGGVAADAYDRRKIVLVSQSVGFCCAALFVLLNSLSAPSIAWFYLLFVINGAALAFEAPSRASMLPRLVPPEELGRAVTVMSTVQAMAFVTGPALAGLLIGSGGPRVPCILACVLLAISWALVAGVRESQPPPTKKPAVGLTALREGLGYVLKNRAVLGALSIDLFAVLFGGATAMLPVYASDILHVGAHGYGILAAALDVGAVATSLALVFLPPIRRIGRAIVLSVLVYGMATIAFGLSKTFPVALLAYVMVGIADQVSVVSRSTLVQMSTPDDLRGRVSSVSMVFILASNQLSVAESGFVAAMTSPQFSVVAGGVMVFVVSAIIAVVVPQLWRYER